MRIWHVLLLSVSVILLSGCDLWGEKETVVQPSPLPAISGAKHLQQQWSLNVGNAKQDLPFALAQNKQQLFISDGEGQVSAIDKQQGKLLWKIDMDTTLSSNIALSDESVFVTDAGGKVYALNIADGSERWHSDIGNQALATPTVAVDKVLLKTIDGNVIALAAKTGKQLWLYPHQEPALILRRSSAVVVAGQLAVMGFADGQVAALDIATGKLRWMEALALATGISDVERMIDIDANLIVNNEIIYVTSYQGQMSSMMLWTGHKLWQQPFSSYTGMDLAAKQLFAVDEKDRVFALMTEDGKEQWKQAALSYRQLTAPRVFDDYLLLGDGQGYLHVLTQAKGEEVTYSKMSSAPITAAPIVDGKVIYVASNDGKIAAYRLLS